MSELKNKPENTPFKQQQLPAFQPIYTAKSSALVFLIAGILFYAFGFPIYVVTSNVIEVSKQYDNICEINKQCTLTIKIDEKIPEPVFLYYELKNFYQNHRLFVRSKSYSQLRNAKKIIPKELEFCAPALYNKDFSGYYNESKAKELDPDDVAWPCGMIARSVFNDTYNIEGYEIDEDDIVYSNDKKMWVNENIDKQWRDIDHHLIVWMKISPYSNFRKLWGVINKDVEKGELKVVVDNKYDVEGWDGEKWIVLSNASAFGGKNPNLGIILIAAGTVALLFALIFTVTGIVYKHSLENEDPKTWRYT